MRRKLVGLTAGVLVLAAVGCGSGNQPGPNPSPSGPSGTGSGTASVAPTLGVPTSPSPTSSAAPTSAATFSDVPTSAQPASPSGELRLTEVRVGSHPGYDRVVAGVEGGSPDNLGWRLEYDPEPRTQGRGDPVDLPGTETLRLIIFGLTYPPEGAAMPSGLQPDSNQGNITGVYVDPVFEGQAQIFIGLEQRRGFQVTMLDSPTRIVVDIQNP